MKRRQLLAATAAAAILPRRAHAADRLSVLLDWFINPNHAPLVVGQQIGAFSRRGLEIDLVQPADPSMPPRLVAAGHGDIAINYQWMIYRQALSGLPLMRIGVLQDRALVSLCTLKKSGIETLAHLKGKRVGYNDVAADVGFASLAAMLHTAGLALSDVTLVNVGTALTTSLMTGRIDAVPIVRNFEAFEIADLGQTPVCFDYEKYGVPATDGFVFDVQKDRVRDPRFSRFLDGVKEATAYVKAKPAESWALFLKAYPDLDNKLNKQAWDYTLAYFADDPFAFDREKYRTYGAFLVEHKVIDRNPRADEYAAQLSAVPA